MKRYQKGDAGAAMLVMMVVMLAVGWWWSGHMGMGHGGGRADHASEAPRTAHTEKTALDLLDEAYARGEIARDEYLRKREDLMKP